ncbi:hypothetical protein [Streptomyces sp. NPDC007088]|uniref:hypothetical protein n=1 Tax=Streptomyces sp. NPDC007088 TaxID=3364773 RepID=UPI0036BDDAEF
MQFLITDDHRRILAAIDVPETPDGEAANIGIERADRPDLLYVGADLYGDGTVSVGHWPQGEEWESLVRTDGVPDPCGHTTPAHPAEPTYTRAQVEQALRAAEAQLTPSTGSTKHLGALVRATLDLLATQAT